ncbi:hypothetical protein FEM48_Zijuj07G0128400 [Ziziphus jujuba var. spinosa]|uniref:Membrane-associated kinase regulator 1 n=1 Tax=Ziziphus jujuba var. spinosa TaxID=714518 RepID=A0A978V4R1_ZIZJJ|nr:hypothetical protein FEM48_Zijuj07G0128400 [Ziziphus jujuba var. spinosa]
MGRRLDNKTAKSHTLPSSPSHSFSSSSSSDFEFTISVSPRKSSTVLCPADELFYKGQLLPLHLSSRLSMVRTLLLASSSTSSSSDTTTVDSRDSTGSSNDSHSSFSSDLVLLAASAESCDSSRPSSVTAEDDEFKRLNNSNNIHLQTQIKKSNKYFSLSRFSSVFKKDPKQRDPDNNNISGLSSSSVKKLSSTAKEVIRKYFKKVKPLYEKLSQKQKMENSVNYSVYSVSKKTERSNAGTELLSSGNKCNRKENNGGTGGFSHSFSGNLKYPRRSSCVSSCPSSMRSSPTHSGVLCRPGLNGNGGVKATGGGMYYDTSSMEELQSAIQGAIAHCKNSLIQSSKATGMGQNYDSKKDDLPSF